MKSVLILLLFLYSLQLFAGQKPLYLIYASSLQHSKYGYSQQDFRFKILVKKTNIEKKVLVILNNKDFDDYNAYAVKIDDLGSNSAYELWKASVQFRSNSVEPIRSVDFSVQLYHVGARDAVFEDRNTNYHLDPSDGPMLVGKEVLLETAYQDKASFKNQVVGFVDVVNIAKDKKVKIIYTLDNWKTHTLVHANYRSIFTRGYSSFNSPNKHNVERWFFSIALDADKSYKPNTSQKFDYYIEYNTAGKIFYDNNFSHMGHYRLELE